MRRIFITLFSLALATMAYGGQEDGSALLLKMDEKIGSFGDYKVSLVADVDDYIVEGEFIVSKDKYYIIVGADIGDSRGVDYEIVCDGEARYEIDHSNEEVIVDFIDPEDRVIFNNPTKAFDFAIESFKSYHTGSKVVDGKKCEMISLLPLMGETTLGGIYLTIDSKSYLPVELKYSIEGLDNEIVVKIKSIKGVENVDASMFKFKSEKYPEFEVVDFR